MRYRDGAWWRQWQGLGELVDPSNGTGWRHSRPGPHHRWEYVYIAAEGVSWKLLDIQSAWPTRFTRLLRTADQQVGCLLRETRHKAAAPRTAGGTPESQTGPPFKKASIVFWESQLWQPCSDLSGNRGEIVGDNKTAVFWANAYWFPQKLFFRSTVALDQHTLEDLYVQGNRPRVDHDDFTRHASREHNTKADYYANKLCDEIWMDPKVSL
jgi:hypothetical protein